MSKPHLAIAVLWTLISSASASAQGAAVTVSPEKTAPPVPIDLTLPIREGDVRVSGRGGPAKAVMVRVYSGWTTEIASGAVTKARGLLEKMDDSTPVGERRAVVCQVDEAVATVGPTSVTDGKFDVLLPRRLTGGDCVVVEDAAPGSGVKPASAIVQSVILDLGRVRGYFSLGGAVSRNRNAFAQTDTFAAFTVDARVLGWVISTPCKRPDRTRDTPENCEDVGGGKYREVGRSMRLRDVRMQINAFADARVGFKLAATGTTGTATATTGGQPAQPPFQRPDQLVFNADQPGYFQVGLHAPMSAAGMDWRNNGRLYSFYAGPLVKFGAQSFGAPVIQTRTVDIDLTKPATDTARYAIKSETSEGGAQPFYSVGARVGIFGYDMIGQELRHRQVANDPVGYLDITWGRSTGFRSYEFTHAISVDGKTETVAIDSRENRRLVLEGRMKIPYLPALIGVDLNVRSNRSSEEPNDFRFTLAFRVDAQKALGRIFTGDALTQDR
jgi:hypothetical protein